MTDAVKLDSFDHIGHVVSDRDATMASWTKLFGVEWGRIVESGSLKMATGKLGSVDVELLQPTDDKSLWAEFLKAHGEGLHHVCCRVGDVDEAASKLQAEGGNVMISIPGAMAYVDIGGPGSVILELLKTPGQDQA
jgi:4-hydroxyphenylpyruvate dioxygenase-like putative hemolysin